MRTMQQDVFEKKLSGNSQKNPHNRNTAMCLMWKEHGHFPMDNSPPLTIPLTNPPPDNSPGQFPSDNSFSQLGQSPPYRSKPNLKITNIHTCMHTCIYIHT